jgi:hypothetical protein
MSRASGCGGWGLLDGAPGEEEAVGFDIVPIGDGPAVGLAAVAEEEFEEFVAVKPFFPGGGIEAAPVFGVLVDDGEAAAGLEDAAEFGDGGFDVDGVFEGFSGVDAIEGVVLEGEGEEGSGDTGQIWTGKLEHGDGEVHGDDGGFWILFADDAGESAFPATGVEGAAGFEGAEGFEDEADVGDPGVDGGGEVLFIGGGILKGTPDLGGEIRREIPRRARAPEPLLEQLHQARVRKMGRPRFLA